MPHRALTVDEILREVASRVTEIHPPTAVALARCAKFLEEPTLSSLWKIQDALLTLFMTLPPNSWQYLIGYQFVRGLPYLRRCFTVLEDSPLKLPVFGVDARSGPVGRRMGQVFEIRVLDDRVEASQWGDNLRRGVPTTLRCDLS